MKLYLLRKNKTLLYIITVLLSLLFLFSTNRYVSKDLNIFEDDTNNNVINATVQKVINIDEQSRNFDDETTIHSTEVTFTAKIRNSDFNGRLVEATQIIDGYSYIQQKHVEPGDKILLLLSEVSEDSFEWRFIEYQRSDKLILLGVFFLVLLIIFGKSKGLNTILSLSFTTLAVFGIFVPSILSGNNIYVWTVIVSIYVILSTLLIIGGYNRKTLAAIIGCFSGIAAGAILVLIMDKVLLLTGFLDEHSLYIVNLPLENPINLRGLIFAGIIIGALGAIMDVSVSIASSLWEIKTTLRNVTFDSLYKSGINIGRDIMGTMSNTLILAYIGGSLSLVLLLSAYSSSMLELFNREMIVAEILKALIGSLGILLTMPLTSIISSALYTNKKISRS